jgi:sugar phosphate isomerase/epimerase
MNLSRRATVAALGAAPFLAAAARKMKIMLSPGSIGVSANQLESIEYAHKFGYEAVEPQARYFATQTPAQIAELTADVHRRGLVWGNAGLPVDFRRDEALFREGLAAWPAAAKALSLAKIDRVTTYVLPFHDTLTYVANLRQHGARLRECAKICADQGQRLGLEYVGPRTMWSSKRYPFVHSMAEMRDLFAEIGESNVGFVLDSWHWYTAGEGEAELRTLKPAEIVSVDLNDAPTGRAVEQQIDSQRELPCATGVIDVKLFLNTLHQIGCDAPVRCEPFNAPLRAMPREQALETTINAMKKAMALIA